MKCTEYILWYNSVQLPFEKNLLIQLVSSHSRVHNHSSCRSLLPYLALILPSPTTIRL